jgi:hypothetical protein
MGTPRPVLLLALTVGLSACGAGWHRLGDLTPRALPARTQVQMWQGEDVTLLHGVEITPDSIYGVPFTEPPSCDSCRVRLALTAVDSLRSGNKERGFFRTVGVVLAVGLVWAYLARGIGGD